MANKIMWFGMLVLACGMIVVGCVSYNHTQAVRNETGFTITEVYIRDAGTTDWGNVRNVQARRDSVGNVMYRQDGSVAYWDRTNMNDGTQIVFFTEKSSSETPRGMRNKDIAVKDSNGLLYMKSNIPITFTTTKNTTYYIINGPNETVSSTSPIVFTVEDRLPMLFVVNQTGYTVTLTSPVQNSIPNQGRTQFQPMEMNRSIDVTYKIGQAQYTEQVTMGNKDATVTLTKRPPTLTIVNNVGATVNTIFLRIPGTPTWIGGNIVTRDGQVQLSASRGAQAGEISGSIVNRDNMKIWLGNVPITGDTFDIRIDDMNSNSYVKSNVQVTSDMTLTFTQSDKR
jgi:hypothetical protein